MNKLFIVCSILLLTVVGCKSTLIMTQHEIEQQEKSKLCWCDATTESLPWSPDGVTNPWSYFQGERKANYERCMALNSYQTMKLTAKYNHCDD